jgi:dTDP-4-dehydrorhamnose reductase
MTERPIYRVAVTGSNGQLGKELAIIAPKHPRFNFIFLSRQNFPLDEPEKMKDWLEKNTTDFFIHCAAYTTVDKAESEKELAYLVNATASGLIASHLSKTNTKLLFISTDYVFDGSSSSPLNESAPTKPVNWYGETKLEGERLVLKNNPNTIVLRTSWVYSAFGNNFLKTMMRIMKERTSVRVVADQKGSPTYAADLAGAILQILESERFTPGIYHYSNEGETSWFGFAQEIKKLIQSSCEVTPIPTSEFQTAAKRPAYSLLDKSKIKRDYQLVISDWQSSLAICIESIKQGV